MLTFLSTTLTSAKEIKFSDKANAFAYAADLGAECFAKMDADTQNWILTRYTLLLKEDILNKLDGTHGAHLEDSIKVVAATRPALLKHFGAGDAMQLRMFAELTMSLNSRILVSNVQHVTSLKIVC